MGKVNQSHTHYKITTLAKTEAIYTLHVQQKLKLRIQQTN